MVRAVSMIPKPGDERHPVVDNKSLREALGVVGNGDVVLENESRFLQATVLPCCAT